MTVAAAWSLPSDVSVAELQRLHSLVKEHLLSKFGTYTAAFRSIDRDATGLIEREEFERVSPMPSRTCTCGVLLHGVPP